MENQIITFGIQTLDFLFDWPIWQGIWSNFLFAVIGASLIFIVFRFFHKRKINKIFGLNKKNRLTVFFSNTFVVHALDTDGKENLYTGSAVPANEFKTIKELFDLLALVSQKDNTLVRLIKSLTFDMGQIEYELSPPHQIQLESYKDTNILTMGSPAYNNATSYFQKEKTVLFFDEKGIVHRENNSVIATEGTDYDYAILERIEDEGRIVIIAAGFHINGTRGAIRYLVKNWRKLPNRFAYVIKFLHPSKNDVGYKKPLEIKNFKR